MHAVYPGGRMLPALASAAGTNRGTGRVSSACGAGGPISPHYGLVTPRRAIDRRAIVRAGFGPGLVIHSPIAIKSELFCNCQVSIDYY